MLNEMMAHCHLTFMQVSMNFVQTMLVVNTLMHQQELPFSDLDLLHVYTVVLPKKEPSTHLLKGNNYLWLRNPRQPLTRLLTDIPDKDVHLNEFVWVLKS